MCGIAGKIHASRPVNSSEVELLIEPLAHRGPDDSGVEVFGKAGLGHRRLAILDLSPAGHNPMTTTDGRYTIVFNGESYNFEHNRRDLEKKGYVFNSDSDTEVVLNMFAEYGPEMMDRIDGMFAFAIWDAKEESLFAARDRFGQKPFVYSEVGDSVIFASEIKSVLQDPSVQRDIDLQAVYDFLHVHYIPAPRTGFAAIRKLPAAHSLTWKNGVMTIQKYWEYSYQPKHGIDETTAVEETIQRLRRSVEQRMISDVPIGAHLSGGLDSSLIVALMSQLSSTPVKTFSIGFDDPSLNELPFAEKVAEAFNTDHQSFMVTAESESLIPALAALYDEPYADAAALPYYALSRETKKHVTVALNGDGGDENFSGYRRYLTFQKLQQAGIAYALTGMIAPVVAPVLPSKWKQRVELIRASRRATTIPELYRLVKEQMLPAKLDSMLHPTFREQVREKELQDWFEKQWKSVDATNTVDQLTGLDIRTYLADGLTKKVDLASMAHSLEVRSPFLDHHLMEWTSKLPQHMKTDAMDTKLLLKKVGESLVPQDIFNRKKQPFIVPLDRWLRTSLQPLVKNTLLSESAKIGQFIRKEHLQRTISQHMSGKRNDGTTLYAWVMLELWLQEHQ